MKLPYAIGLFAFRFAIARALPRRVNQASLRPISVAFAIASVIGVAGYSRLPGRCDSR